MMNSLLHHHNQAKTSVIRHSRAKPTVQPKLTVNTPGDIYEQEADAMADRVMRMSTNETAKPVTGLIGKSLQRKCAHCEEEEKRKTMVMRKVGSGNAGLAVSSSFASSLNASKGGGSPLPQRTRSFMENAFSADFSSVRIHTDGQAAEMSRGINANAFTYGNDIYFKDGANAINSGPGKKLLAHELTHVVQQNHANNFVQRDLATPPPQVALERLPDLTPAEVQRAIFFNRARYDSRVTRIIQNIIGVDQTGSWNEESVRAVAHIQEEYGLKKDGMVGADTFRWLDIEMNLEGSSTDTLETLLLFNTPTGNVIPRYKRIGAFHFIEGHFFTEAQFSERTNCRDWEYRQLIRGNAWGQKPGFSRANLNHFFNLLPHGSLDLTWREDGNTSWAGINYGRRGQPGRRSNPVNEYQDDAGSQDQTNGCIYKGEDYPKVTDAALATGDTIALELEFKGEIYRRDSGGILRFVTRKSWTVNGSVIVP